VVPHSAFAGQTPDEMYFERGAQVPVNLAAARILVVHGMRSMFVFLCKDEVEFHDDALLDGRTLNVATCDLSADNLDRLPIHKNLELRLVRASHEDAISNDIDLLVVGHDVLTVGCLRGQTEVTFDREPLLDSRILDVATCWVVALHPYRAAVDLNCRLRVFVGHENLPSIATKAMLANVAYRANGAREKLLVPSEIRRGLRETLLQSQRVIPAIRGTNGCRHFTRAKPCQG